MNDIVERLRNPAFAVFGHPTMSSRLDTDRTIADLIEAANEIERLRAILDKPVGHVLGGQPLNASFSDIKKEIRDGK